MVMQDSRRLLRTFTVARSLASLSALGLLLAASPASAAVALSTAAAAAFDATVIADGLGQPVDVAVLPDGKVLVIERQGDVLIYAAPEGDPTTAHIDVESGPAEQGLLGVVLDPNFATNQFIYFYASAGQDTNNRHQVLRYKLGADGMLSEQQVVINMGLRGPANHNGGSLDIYGGNIYVGVGDTGDNSATPQNKFSSCLNIANGKVLRVSLADATLGQPAADNPLMAEDMVTGCESTRGDFGMFAPEKRVYAWGFRNPFRLWVDDKTGKLWVGDVGEEGREEVSVGESGHYGYPFFEGTTEYNQMFKPDGACMGMTPGVPCTAPAYDWPRGGGGTAVGGRILDGCGWPAEWTNRYIFGDYVQNDIWTLEVNAERTAAMQGSVEDFATADGPAAFRMGTDNALYIAEAKGGGRVTRITAKGMAAAPNSCAAVNDAPGNNMGGAGGGGNAGSPAGGNPPAGGNGAGGSSSGGSPSGAGSGNNPTAGTPGNPGAGTSGATDRDLNNEGGCGCRAAGGGGSMALGLGLLTGALGLSLVRRRRGRRA
jgi:glucose/arabinose dehydrogenase